MVNLQVSSAERETRVLRRIDWKENWDDHHRSHYHRSHHHVDTLELQLRVRVRVLQPRGGLLRGGERGARAGGCHVRLRLRELEAAIDRRPGPAGASLTLLAHWSARDVGRTERAGVPRRPVAGNRRQRCRSDASRLSGVNAVAGSTRVYRRADFATQGLRPIDAQARSAEPARLICHPPAGLRRIPPFTQYGPVSAGRRPYASAGRQPQQGSAV